MLPLIPISNVSAQDWVDLMLEEDANFFEVRDAFYQEWGNKPYERGKGYKQFKRWEWFWEYRINPDGTFPKYLDQWRSVQAFRSNNQLRAGGGGGGYWTPLGPFTHTVTDSWSPGQGRVNVVAEDPSNSSVIYVGAPAGGIWKTTDGGSSWTPLGDDLPVIGVSGIAIPPTATNTVYISTGDNDAGDTYSIGVWKSTNGGNTFTQTGNINANSTGKIIVHPTDANTLYVATSGGLYKTIDGGTNWNSVRSGNYDDVAMKPNDPNTIYVCDDDDVFVSTNGGTSWSTATGLPNNSGRLKMAVTAANPNYIYVVSAASDNSFQGVYRSSNSGTSFSPRNTTTDIFDGSNQAWYDLAIAADPNNAERIFVGVLNVHRSTNGGTSWTQLNSWSNAGGAAYTHADIHFLHYFGNRLYCGSDGGIYRSTNNGSAFTDLTIGGLQIGQFYTISGSEADVTTIAGGLQDNGGYAYTNGSWKVYYGADGMESAVDPVNSNIIYGMIQNGSLYYTTNGGASVQNAGSPMSGVWVTPMQRDPNAQRLLVGYDELYEYDYSNGWAQISNNNFPASLRKVEVHPANSNIIYVATYSNVYRSTNGGSSWTNITSGLTTGNGITSIETHNTNQNEVWITVGGSTGSNRVYHSSNQGGTYTNLTGSLPNVPINVIKYEANTNGGVYIGTDIGVYYYDNNISQWTDFNNQLPNVIVNDLEINVTNGVIRAGSYGRGVWESGSYNQTTVSDDAGISSIVSPGGTACGVTINPVVVLRNWGTNSLNSCTINYDVDGGTPQTFQFNGVLAPASDTTISLNSIVAAPGNHTFNAWTTSPNGTVDGNQNNDANQASFTTTSSGAGIVVELTTDCWGSETSWELRDANSTVVGTGGPYADGTPLQIENTDFCLAAGCYEIEIFDSYGDGVFGSQWQTCQDDGNLRILDDQGNVLVQLAQPDFGTDTVLTFCVTGTLAAFYTTNVTQVCAGTSITFLDQSSGGVTSHSWVFQGGNPATSTSQNPQVTYNTPGTYDVSLTVSDGNTSDTNLQSGYIVVVPSPAGSASSTNELCDGDCDGTVSASATGGTTPYNYTWSNGLGSGQTVSAVCPGTYNLVITDANNCVASGISATVGAGAATPTADFSASATQVFLDQGGSVTFTDNSSGATAWAWDFGDSNNSTQQNPTHTYTTPGTYTVTLVVTNGNNCSDQMTETITVDETSAIGENPLEAFVSVYPNPTGGQLTVELAELDAEKLTVEVFDVVGKLVASQAPLAGQRVVSFSIADQAAGLYYVRVEVDGQSITREISLVR